LLPASNTVKKITKQTARKRKKHKSITKKITGGDNNNKGKKKGLSVTINESSNTIEQQPAKTTSTSEQVNVIIADDEFKIKLWEVPTVKEREKEIERERERRKRELEGKVKVSSDTAKKDTDKNSKGM